MAFAKPYPRSTMHWLLFHRILLTGIECDTLAACRNAKDMLLLLLCVATSDSAISCPADLGSRGFIISIGRSGVTMVDLPLEYPGVRISWFIGMEEYQVCFRKICNCQCGFVRGDTYLTCRRIGQLTSYSS